jgi:hypothetical protein
MLKELTLIQEEKIRSTALIRNQNNNSTSSENSNNFTKMKLLLNELKCKYQNSRKEWNDMQAKQDSAMPTGSKVDGHCHGTASTECVG